MPKFLCHSSIFQIFIELTLISLILSQPQPNLPSENGSVGPDGQQATSHPPPSNPDDSSEGLVVIWSKRCTASTECNWSFECKKFKRSLSPGADATDVFNCVQCRASCRSDADCQKKADGSSSNNNNSVFANPEDRLKCFHGCCKPKALEREIMRPPILRSAQGNLRRIPLNLPVIA